MKPKISNNGSYFRIDIYFNAETKRNSITQLFTGILENTVSYRLFNNDFRVQKAFKRRRSGFLTSIRQHEKFPPFNSVVLNCSFEVVVLTAEMLNGELRTSLHLKELNAKHIHFDLSHRSLQHRALKRYLPDITKDLSTNPYVKSVDFVFQAVDEGSNSQLKATIPDSVKNFAIVFLEAKRG